MCFMARVRSASSTKSNASQVLLRCTCLRPSSLCWRPLRSRPCNAAASAGSLRSQPVGKDAVMVSESPNWRSGRAHAPRLVMPPPCQRYASCGSPADAPCTSVAKAMLAMPGECRRVRATGRAGWRCHCFAVVLLKIELLSFSPLHRRAHEGFPCI